jgi:hypothetical protein
MRREDPPYRRHPPYATVGYFYLGKWGGFLKVSLYRMDRMGFGRRKAT